VPTAPKERQGLGGDVPGVNNALDGEATHNK